MTEFNKGDVVSLGGDDLYVITQTAEEETRGIIEEGEVGMVEYRPERKNPKDGVVGPIIDISDIEKKVKEIELR